MVNKILFIGSKSLGFSFLKKLESINYGKKIFVLTIDDSNDERSVLNDIINFSEERGLPTHVISKPSMLKSVLLEVNPDICFVVGWYWILPYDLIKSVKYGFLGFHASLLPKLRGFAPLVWAILNGEKKTGVTLFYFDEGVDSGDIVDQYGFEIGENDYIADLLKKAKVILLLQLVEMAQLTKLSMASLEKIQCLVLYQKELLILLQELMEYLKTPIELLT